jgi:hypothetical protein
LSIKAIQKDMRKCPLCGGVIHSGDDLVCFRCKDTGGHVRLEIYDRDPGNDPEDSFSKVFMGSPHFGDMQKKNIRRGGFS